MRDIHSQVTFLRFLVLITYIREIKKIYAGIKISHEVEIASSSKTLNFTYIFVHKVRKNSFTDFCIKYIYVINTKILLF